MSIDLFFMDLMEKIKNIFLDSIATNIVLEKATLIWIILIVTLICIKKTRKLGIILGISFLITLILGEGILKKLIARERPFITYNYEILVKKPTSFSFPSSNAALSFAVFGAFLFNKNKYSILIGLFASIIAISRIYLGIHYFTDILGGIFLGLLVSYFVTKFYNKKLTNGYCPTL